MGTVETVYVSVGGIIEKQIRAKKLEVCRIVPKDAKLTAWKTTAGEIALINAGNSSALASFFFHADNYKHITFSAYQFMRNNGYLKSVISYEDLIQQFFVDLLTGVLMLRPYDRAINRAMFESFRYAAVGGLDENEIYIPYPKER